MGRGSAVTADEALRRHDPDALVEPSIEEAARRLLAWVDSQTRLWPGATFGEGLAARQALRRALKLDRRKDS